MVLCLGFVNKPALITHPFLATAEQCLHSAKVFSAKVSHAALPASRLVMGKRLGGDTAPTGDPKGIFRTT